MIVAGIELTPKQIFALQEHFYGEYDKEFTRKMLDVLQVHAGIKGDEAVDAYIAAHRGELVERHAPNMRRYFDEGVLGTPGGGLTGPLESLWDDLPWDDIDKKSTEEFKKEESA